MAFGHADTDNCYDKLIKPVIAAIPADFTLRRLDRINHNNEITDKLREEMRKGDLCIADLTYARPSVYFESGYMEGQRKPCIYTCRADHLRKNSPEELSVHFDLQNKNIIPWEAKGVNKDFKRKLKDRLQLVSAPILADRETTERLAVERSKWKARSVSARNTAVTKEITRQASAAGFAEIKDDPKRYVSSRRLFVNKEWQKKDCALYFFTPSSLNQSEIDWIRGRDIVGGSSSEPPDRRLLIVFPKTKPNQATLVKNLHIWERLDDDSVFLSSKSLAAIRREGWSGGKRKPVSRGGRCYHEILVWPLDRPIAEGQPIVEAAIRRLLS